LSTSNYTSNEIPLRCICFFLPSKPCSREEDRNSKYVIKGKPKMIQGKQYRDDQWCKMAKSINFRSKVSSKIQFFYNGTNENIKDEVRDTR